MYNNLKKNLAIAQIILLISFAETISACVINERGNRGKANTEYIVISFIIAVMLRNALYTEGDRTYMYLTTEPCNIENYMYIHIFRI